MMRLSWVSEGWTGLVADAHDAHRLGRGGGRTDVDAYDALVLGQRADRVQLMLMMRIIWAREGAQQM